MNKLHFLLTGRIHKVYISYELLKWYNVNIAEALLENGLTYSKYKHAIDLSRFNLSNNNIHWKLIISFKTIQLI